MARMPYTNFHDINLDWIIKRVMKAFTPDNPPDSDDIIDTDSGLNLTAELRKKQNRPESDGTAGQVLGLGNDLQPVWLNQPDPTSIIDDNAGGGDTDKVYSANHVTGLISPIIDDITDIVDNVGDIKNAVIDGHYGFYDKTQNTTGQYLKADGTTGSQSGWNYTGFMPVVPNVQYYCYGQTSSSTVKTCFYDSEKTFITDSGLRIYSQKYWQKLTPPANAKFVRFSISDTIVDTFKYDLITSNKPSIWNGAQYISHGDSITWQDGKEYIQGEHIGEIARGYQTVFAEAVSLARYNNQGASGYPMAVVDNHGVVNVIMNIASYESYDLCTIACGTNDFKSDVPLGSIGQIGDTTFDDTTFYGAYRKAIEYILSSSPTIRIVLMTPLQRDNAGYNVNTVNGAGHKLVDYVNAVKAIGEMYGLPVCDMYGNSGFTKKTLSTYTMDGLHPNDVGYKRMGDYLTGFLNAIGN